MVTRVYECDTCDNEVEIQCEIRSPAAPRPCGVPDCLGTMHVVIQPVAIRFKGEGFTRAGVTAGGKSFGDDIYSGAYDTGDGEIVPPVKIDRVTGSRQAISQEEYQTRKDR